MNNNDFETLLKNANLSKKDFSVLVEMSYNSVTNWNSSNKIPNWVKSWLELYIENKACKELKAKMVEAGLCS